MRPQALPQPPGPRLTMGILPRFRVERRRRLMRWKHSLGV